MKTLLTGATGMVGGEVLRYCLADDRITSVLSVGRRRSGLNDPKLIELEHDNFHDFSDIEDQFREAELCLYCIGVYQNAVPADKFWEVTCDYQAAFVASLERVAPGITFCLFGAQGADPSEKSWFRFAKAKGRAEKMLFDSKLARKYVFRPGFINPVRDIPGQSSYKYMRPIYRLFPGLGIDADKLAKVMVDTGITGADQHVFENGEMRGLVY